MRNPPPLRLLEFGGKKGIKFVKKNSLRNDSFRGGKDCKKNKDLWEFKLSTKSSQRLQFANLVKFGSPFALPWFVNGLYIAIYEKVGALWKNLVKANINLNLLRLFLQNYLWCQLCCDNFFCQNELQLGLTTRRIIKTSSWLKNL